MSAPRRYPFRVTAWDRFGEHVLGRYETFEDARRAAYAALPFRAEVLQWHEATETWRTIWRAGDRALLMGEDA